MKISICRKGRYVYSQCDSRGVTAAAGGSVCGRAALTYTPKAQVSDHKIELS